MVQRPFVSWESRFVKIWTTCNLQHEHHDPRKAILSLVFYTITKLSIAFLKARVYVCVCTYVM